VVQILSDNYFKITEKINLTSFYQTSFVFKFNFSNKNQKPRTTTNGPSDFDGCGK